MFKVRFIKTKVVLGVLCLILAVVLVFAVFMAEKRKDIIKQRNALQTAENDAQQYREEYIESIQQLKEEYAVSMTESKKVYDNLLQQQATIVAEHTQKVQVGTSVTNTGSGSTATSTKTVTVQKKVAKPKAKTSTKTS